MLAGLPNTSEEISRWEWSDLEPFYRELLNTELNPENVTDWLSGWTRLTELVNGRFFGLRTAVSQNTADKELEEKYNYLLKNILPQVRSSDNSLIKKLLVSELVPEGMEIPIKKLRVAAEIFREENLPLLTQEQMLNNEYAKITGAQTVVWDGEEVTLIKLRLLLQSQNREVREKSWRASMERALQDRQALNELYARLLELRVQIAANAGFSRYTDYRWKLLNRFDYTPQDCHNFHEAIEKAVVPAARRVYERRKQRLGVETLRPWDLEVNPLGLEPLVPYRESQELESKTENILRQVDPELGEYFALMRRDKMLDLNNRPNKAPGGYCTSLLVNGQKSPFIFMNGVGRHRDVITLLHEAGHSFHAFEMYRLPYHQQRISGSEFNEVASMSMEFLASPFLAEEKGGFYTTAEAARARVEHLEERLLFWPYMAVVDAFQLWVYDNPDIAVEAGECDKKWGELWQRFMPGEDWSGLEDACVTGWHRKLHIFQYPFYYVEYGMAQLGAVQVWANSLEDHHKAVANYRHAHRLGGTVSLPQQYEAAGAAFKFDVPAMSRAVELIERTIEELEPAYLS
jgi:oligoendopeptidase F